MPSERLLYGFINDSHSAATDAAKNAVLTELLQQQPRRVGAIRFAALGGAGNRVKLFDQQSCGEQLPDFGG